MKKNCIKRETTIDYKRQTKQEMTIHFLRFILAGGPTAASEIIYFFKIRGIGQRTVETAKKDAGIRSYRRDGQWFWEMPETGRRL